MEQKVAEKKAEKFLGGCFTQIASDLDLGKNCELSCWISKQCAEDFSSEEPYGFAVWTVRGMNL